MELPPAIGGQPTVEKQRVVTGRFGSNEGWSANAAAEALQVPVIPYDREGRNEWYQQTKYFDRQAQLSRRVNDWLKKEESRKEATAEAAILGPLLKGMTESQMNFVRIAGPEIINSEGFDQIIRTKHLIWLELLPQLSEKVTPLNNLAGEAAFLRNEWRERNRIMADHIAAEARKRPGRRVVVLCGAEHRYILRDLLSSVPDIRLREYYDGSLNNH
jgi:hypothetical protein